MPSTLRPGDFGADVSQWQRLIGMGPRVDGRMDDFTVLATIKWQTAHRLVPDGIVGPKSWAAALSPFPRPDFAPLGARRAEVFGAFEWSDDDNDGWIKIHGSWAKDHIITLVVPQLRGIASSNSFPCHVKAAEPLLGFFSDIEQAGLLDRVKSFGGCWAPRRIRRAGGGFSDALSAHAWGTAIDINVAWNGLGKAPASKDAEGSVVELLPAAYKHGLYWGGLFGSPDGMHFELAKVIA